MKPRWMFFLLMILSIIFLVIGLPVKVVALNALLMLAMLLLFFPRDSFFDW